MSARRYTSLLAIAGGLAIATGACLPWMSYFAGLHPLRGIIGWYGRILLAIGLAAVGLAVWQMRRRGRMAVFAMALLGASTTAAAIWLLDGLRQLTRPGRIHPMMVARGGPGLWVVLAGGLSLLLAALCSAISASAAPLPTPPVVNPSLALWTEMRNVNLHIDQTAFMRLWLLRGQVMPTTPGAVPALDDPTSFSIRVTSGTVALDGDGLSALMNEVAFHYDGAPIRHLRIEIEDSVLVQHGIMHKGVDIPFTMRAVPKLMSDGSDELVPISMRIFGGVDGFKLLHALGLRLSSMLGGLRGAHGVTVEGDNLFLNPTGILPPPAIQGRLTALHIDGPLLVQDFATAPDDTIFRSYVRPDSGANNYVYFRGGHLRFGKLLMTDTDLLIRDADERDPFDLMLSEYNRQLAAGYTRNLTDYGLRTFMVDYNKLGKQVAAANR